MVFRRSILLDWTEAWSPKKWWDKMDQILWSNLEDNDASSQERTVATQYIWIIPTCQCAHHNVPVGLVSRIINGLVRTWLLTFPRAGNRNFLLGLYVVGSQSAAIVLLAACPSRAWVALRDCMPRPWPVMQQCLWVVAGQGMPMLNFADNQCNGWAVADL